MVDINSVSGNGNIQGPDGASQNPTRQVFKPTQARSSNQVMQPDVSNARKAALHAPTEVQAIQIHPGFLTNISKAIISQEKDLLSITTATSSRGSAARGAVVDTLLAI